MIEHVMCFHKMGADNMMKAVVCYLKLSSRAPYIQDPTHLGRLTRASMSLTTSDSCASPS
jgi:hypothetical protein